ncbi:MAG: hypothetical protein FWG54_00840 [Bacteroidetes bacterium]|nr:hypothetical protein [Bacteroidota bacterium]
MKKLFFPFLLFLLTLVQVQGQERVTVKAGEDINRVSISGKYLFSEFQNARVLRNNEFVEAQMNYNALSGQMEFIDQSGTILALNDKVSIIIFEECIFKQTPKGYLQILADGSGVELLVHKKYEAGDIKKYGAYGTTSSTTAIDTYSAILVESVQASLTPAQDIVYAQKYTYYIYTGGKYRLASKSTFTKVFGKHKPNLEEYLKTNQINFNNQDDLTRLFTYCTQE